MSEQQHLSDEGQVGKYFHFMLNLADDDLDVYEYRLLGHYRRVCGAYNTPCTESTRETEARLKGMSRSTISDTRRALADKGWIKLIDAGNNALHVILVDRMVDNIARYNGAAKPEGSNDERPQDGHSNEKRPPPGHLEGKSPQGGQSGSEADTSPIYSKNQPGNQPDDQESTPPTSESSGESTRAPAPSADADGGGDEFDQKVQALIQSVHMAQATKTRLRGMETAYQIALAWNANEGHTPGALAAHLLANGGPRDDLMEAARTAVCLNTLDRRTIDSHLKQRDLEQLTETVATMQRPREQAINESNPDSPARPPTLLGQVPPGVYDQFNASLRKMLVPGCPEWVYGVRATGYDAGAGVVQVASSGEPVKVVAAFAEAGLKVTAAQVDAVSEEADASADVRTTAQEAVKA